MTKKRILEIIENMLQLGKITEQRINYNRALLDLAQKIIEEVDEDDDMQVREMRRGEAGDPDHNAEGSRGQDQSGTAGRSVPGLCE